MIKRLILSLALCAAALPAASCISDTPGSPGRPGGGDGSYEAMLDRHNDTRAARGVAPLVPDGRLDDIAQDQAEYMAATGVLTHEDSRGGRVDDRADDAGYRWVRIGENVGFAGSAAEVYQLWLESNAHFSNIVNPGYRDIGIGRADRGSREYWCVVFGDN